MSKRKLNKHQQRQIAKRQAAHLAQAQTHQGSDNVATAKDATQPGLVIANYGNHCSGTTFI